jgi:hypothetical protein
VKYFLIALLVCLVLFASCSTDPENPTKFRVRNDRGTDASPQVKTSTGNTINIDNVKPGATSAYQKAATGQVDVTVTIQCETGIFTGGFFVQNNQAFTVVVANTTPPTIAILSLSERSALAQT